jgi:hypothetical protein
LKEDLNNKEPLFEKERLRESYVRVKNKPFWYKVQN